MDKYLQNQTVNTLNFLVCVFGTDWQNVSQVTQECTNRNLNPDPWPAIDECAQIEGDDLLNKLADRVALLNPELSHVPWILVNEVHNLEAEENLIQEVCGTFYPVCDSVNKPYFKIAIIFNYIG
jgi:hypothetical protein